MRLRLLLAVSLGFVLACIGPRPREDAPIVEPAFPRDSGDETDDSAEPTDDSGDTDDPEDPGDLTVATAPTGDLSCFTGDLDRPTPSGEGTAIVEGSVEDWETDRGVEQATVTFLDGSSELGEVEGDADGELGTLQLPACTVLRVGVETPPELQETVPTWSQHVLEADEDALVVPSLSHVTYNIIPGLLGVSVESGTGLVFGRITDCAGEPLDGIEVRLSEADATYRYMVDDFPNRDQAATSEDGWFLAINATPGTDRLTAWAWDGSGHVAVAAADVTVVEDGALLVELRVAAEGGVEVPEACQ